MKRKKTTTDAIEILEAQIGDDPELPEMIERETVNAFVAQMIYDARTEAGLSQRDLAKIIHTSQSTIARLEDSDYSGHSLNMLVRVATALGRHIDIRFADARRWPHGERATQKVVAG